MAKASTGKLKKGKARHVKKAATRIGKVVAPAKRAQGKNDAIRETYLRKSDGERVRVMSLDAHSKTFLNDLTAVFRKNVSRARSENTRLFGSPDGLRKKK